MLDKKKEQARLRKQKQRDKDKANSVTQQQDVTQLTEDVTQLANSVTKEVETVPASYIVGNKGKYKFLPIRPRFLKLTDQVLDRASQPKTKKVMPEMKACNDAWGQRLGKGTDKEKLAKILTVAKSLDKDIVGLSGKKENLMDLVRYGVSGPTLNQANTILSS